MRKSTILFQAGDTLRLLLDTVTFIRLTVEPDKVPKKVRAMIEDTGSNISEISTVSITEIVIKSSRNKLDFSQQDVQDGVDDLQIRILPYGALHAFTFFRLPTHHSDPFDRMLIAQALAEKIAIVTPDEAFIQYKGLKVIW